MEAKLIAALIMLPIALVFIYAGIHEYRRFKSDGRANYGLAYDENTGTTYLTDISDDEEAFDPDDFDPRNYRDQEIRNEPEDGSK